MDAPLSTLDFTLDATGAFHAAPGSPPRITPARRSQNGAGGGAELRPYYEDKYVTLYNADCRTLLEARTLPLCDLCLTDPPYGVGFAYDGYDDTEKALRQLVRDTLHLMRASARVVMLTPGNQNLWMYPEPDHVMAYFCEGGTSIGHWGFVRWHGVLCYGKDPLRPYRKDKFFEPIADAYIWTDLSEPNGHPCPKPLSTWKKLLLRGCPNPNGIILDPFAGSGTGLVAAKELGRKAIGVELNERYCEIAARRLAQDVLSFGGGGGEETPRTNSGAQEENHVIPEK